MTDIPLGMVLEYHALIPAISASETLDRATATAIGTGSAKDGNKIAERLSRTASGDIAAPKKLPNPAMLAALGIKMEMV